MRLFWVNWRYSLVTFDHRLQLRRGPKPIGGIDEAYLSQAGMRTHIRTTRGVSPDRSSP